MSHIHHHEKRTFLVNFLMIPIFIGILVVLTIFSKPVRRIVNLPHQLVQGAHDNKVQDVTKESFTKGLTDDTKDQFESVKDTVLETTLGDVMTFLSKSKQIQKDVNMLGDQAKKMIDNFHFDPVKQINK